MFTSTFPSYNTTDDLWKLLGLDKDSPELKFINDFLSTGRIVIDIIDQLLTQVVNQGATLDLATLLKDSTTLKKLLTSTGGLSEEMVSGLLSGYIKQGKVSDRFTLLCYTGT